MAGRTNFHTELCADGERKTVSEFVDDLIGAGLDLKPGDEEGFTEGVIARCLQERRAQLAVRVEEERKGKRRNKDGGGEGGCMNHRVKIKLNCRG